MFSVRRGERRRGRGRRLWAARGAVRGVREGRGRGGRGRAGGLRAGARGVPRRAQHQARLQEAHARRRTLRARRARAARPARLPQVSALSSYTHSLYPTINTNTNLSKGRFQ